MNCRPTRPGAAGFSFVELLVSIVIAGIAFAALVPVFVGAQQKASGDQMRNIALNIAQSRVEKARALSYNQIAGYDTTQTVTSGSGATKDFTVRCVVSEVGSGLTAYKKVEIDVFWAAPPAPVKHVRLTTMVSKQYAGPQISNLLLSPVNTQGQVTGKPVVMTVTISTADITSMAVNGALKGKVIFYVFSAVNGTQIATYTVNTGEAGNTTPGTYTASWDAASAVDGDYSFRAQAFNNASATTPDPGNVWQRTATLLTNGTPPKVIGLAATPGDGRVTLNWTATTATDLDHYEVWMGTTPGGETNLGVSGLTSNSYIKTGLTNDDDYYFKVVAVDTDGNRSPGSDEASCSPTSMPGVNRPSTPGAFAASPSLKTSELSWTASTQDGTSILGGYYIYRDGAQFASVAAGTTTWSDIVGWSSTHSYYVRAYNLAGRRSYPTATLSVVTGAAPTYTLTVKFSVRSGNPSGSAKVVQTDVSPNVTTGPKTLTKNSSAVFAGIPYGVYTVSVTVNGTTTKTLDVNPLNSTRTVTLAF
jgi:type II secretory pathway pseudopilin PulG